MLDFIMRMIAAVVIVGVCSITITACSDPTTAERALKAAGYTEIVLSGWGPFAGCGNEDAFATRFSAKGPTGVPVSGVVCSGLLKSSTIRLY